MATRRATKAKRKAIGLGEAYRRMRVTLTKHSGGLRFADLAKKTGIPRQELSGLLPSLRGTNLIDYDRQTRRWVLRGMPGIGGTVTSIPGVAS